MTTEVLLQLTNRALGKLQCLSLVECPRITDDGLGRILEANSRLTKVVDGDKLESHHKPHFYHRGDFYLPYDDDRAIDIEMCPKCEKFKLVYDCPAMGCQVKDGAAQVCRSCTLCIARCAQCGRCVNDTEYEETFSLELVCSDCFKQLLCYQDRSNDKIDPFRDPEGPFDTSVVMVTG
ncbi:hypothetical protein F511_41598 [Dorcoceras hygrometricum]|uniref:F-box protein SKIP14 n=1 Tax=Dorcoceras hygrometricum TaxID=472368 RepID=A0A2Z7AUB7_9LAMI|nr:hypothetical protein F511_41598 [Dorcoceras hygrometricum]